MLPEQSRRKSQLHTHSKYRSKSPEKVWQNQTVRQMMKTRGHPQPSKEVKMQQLSQEPEQDLCHVAILTEHDFTPVPRLNLNCYKLARGCAVASQNLQLEERAYKIHFTGAVVNEDTGKSLKHVQRIN